MDLSMPLILVLGLVGYNLNNQIVTRTKKEKRTAISKSETPNGSNVYNEEIYDKVREDEKRRLDGLYLNSIKNTNNYSVSLNGKTPETKLNTIGVFGETENFEVTGPDFKNSPLFNNKMSYNAPEEGSTFSIKEIFDNISPSTGEEMTHINMVPFFGSHLPNTPRDVGLIERLNGELKPIKDAVENMVNGKQNFGSIQFTTAVDPDRFTSGRTRNNVLPFDQYKVPPIPVENTRVSEKTIDELRSLANQKLETKARHLLGSNKIKKGVIRAPNIKKLPDTHFKNTPGMYISNAGNLKQTYSKSEYEKIAGRKVESDSNYIGIATNPRGHVPQIDISEIRIPKKNSTASDTIYRNVGTLIKSRDATEQDRIALPTQERESSMRGNFGNATKLSSGSVHVIEEPLRVTNKQLTLHSHLGTAQNQGPNKPEIRTGYTNITSNNKQSMSYTPGGLNKNLQVVSKPSVSSKNNKHVENYLGISKSNERVTFNKGLIGKVRAKGTTSEHDFSSRLTI